MGFIRTALAATTLAIIAAPSAQAATVGVSGDPSNAIQYVSTEPTAVNDLRVEPVAASDPPTFRVTDPGETLTPGPGCTTVTTHEVTCADLPGQQPIRQMTVELGEQGDHFVNATTLSCICYGGDGGDVMVGGDQGDGGGTDQLYGGPGGDDLSGGTGTDFLDGEDGTDIVRGGDGDDSLTAGSGDTLDGGPGANDSANYRFATGPATIDLPEPGVTATGQGVAGALDSLRDIEGAVGTSEGDVIDGTSHRDNLSGLGGNDTLNGLGDDDILDGGEDVDTLDGGAGADFVFGAQGDDTLNGGTGNDILQGDQDFDFPGMPPVTTPRDDDTINGGPDLDTVTYTHRATGVTVVLPAIGESTGNGDTGTAENDRIRADVEWVETGSGGDSITGNGGANTLSSGPGSDIVDAGDGPDILLGGGGHDLLHGQDGADELRAAQFDAGTEGSVLDGGPGHDQLYGGPNGDLLNGGADGDFLDGGNGVDDLHGMEGDDTMDGGLGADTFVGGADIDQVTYAGRPAGVVARLADGAATTQNGVGGGAEGDTIAPDIERLKGTDFGDDLRGNDLENLIEAGDGNDIVDVAGGGADTARCGNGGDQAFSDSTDTLDSCELTNGGGSQVDQTPPAPVLDQPADVTTTVAPTFTGTVGSAGGDVSELDVEVFSGASATGPPLLTLHTGSGSDFRFSVSAPAPLSAGTFTARAVQSDVAGNRGTSPPRTFRVAGDGTTTTTTTTPPPVPPLQGAPPQNTVAPKVTGIPRVGAVLSANVGGWINGVFEFVVEWRSCAADGRTDCHPTSDAKRFEHEVRADEAGRTLQFVVTANNGFGSSTRVAPLTAPVKGALKMPEVLKAGAVKSLSKVRRALTLAGLCLEADISRCGSKLPVDLRLTRRKRSDLTQAQQRVAEDSNVVEQLTAKGTELGQGDRVRLAVYDISRETGRCAVASLSERQVESRYVGRTFAAARADLADGGCEYAFASVGTDAKATEPKVSTASVDFNTRGERFVQLRLLDPAPRAPAPVARIDSDGDGLWDEWESKGVDTDRDGTVDLDLPAMGASPTHKDLFVEVDFMDGHQLTKESLKAIADSFAAAPVSNPDKVNGISAHIDGGSATIMDPRKGSTWGTRTRANAVPHLEDINIERDTTIDWSDFDSKIKAANFDAARRAVFRYVVAVHKIGKESKATGLSRGLQGAAKLGLPEYDNQTSDVVVTGMQPCAEGHCPMTDQSAAVNLMHELGHVLGLGHGGRSDGAPDITNGKPNHLSIMNYFFSGTGVIGPGGALRLDYSAFPSTDEPLNGRSGQIAPIDEDRLDERAQTRATGTAATYGTKVNCKGGRRDSLNVDLDFNCNGKIEESLAASVNGDASTGILRSRDEWGQITFTTKGIGDFNLALPEPTQIPTGAGRENPLREPPATLVREQAQAIVEDSAAPAVKVRTPRAVRAGRRASVRFTATDAKGLALVVVQADNRPPLRIRTLAKRLTRTVRAPRNVRFVVVTAVDAAGNSTARKVRVRVR